MLADNYEDLLDLFASVALMSMNARLFGGDVNQDYRDNVSRACYQQAESMIRVRKAFVARNSDD